MFTVFTTTIAVTTRNTSGQKWRVSPGSPRRKNKLLRVRVNWKSLRRSWGRDDEPMKTGTGRLLEPFFWGKIERLGKRWVPQFWLEIEIT